MSKRKVLPVPEQVIMDTSKKELDATKDKPLLANYGLGATFFTNFEKDIITASGFKPDEGVTKNIESLTRKKNEKLAEAASWGDEVKVRMQLAFDEKPEIADEFPEDFSKAKKDEKLMLEVIPDINELIDKYAVELKESGLPDDWIEKGKTLREELDAANRAQGKLLSDRPQYTIHRIEAYYKLYKTVNKINKAGRIAYKDSPADLKVFESPWPAAEAKSDEEDDDKDDDNKSDDEKKPG
jgi:hypothetical protein